MLGLLLSDDEEGDWLGFMISEVDDLRIFGLLVIDKYGEFVCDFDIVEGCKSREFCEDLSILRRCLLV